MNLNYLFYKKVSALPLVVLCAALLGAACAAARVPGEEPGANPLEPFGNRGGDVIGDVIYVGTDQSGSGTRPGPLFQISFSRIDRVV